MPADEQLQIRLHGDATLAALIYLPGIHGDWTLVSSFRAALASRVRFVEFTYPRTLNWTLADYANAVETASLAHGVSRGWVLGESFGSQVAWELCGRGITKARLAQKESPRVMGPAYPPALISRDEVRRVSAAAEHQFQPDGLILAGGFVQHPAKWGVRLARRFCRGVSLTWLSRFLFCYAKCARFRHRHAPETLASIAEFIARRNDLDRQAIVHRLTLVHENDPRRLASQTTIPVYSLNGFFDPLVAWWWVRLWLRRFCPGFRGGRTIWLADHNVLGTAPKEAADQVLKWIGGAAH
jgi:pimeloyl-ACP methyl ester carboxylesterase